jgi:hypothetical protein
VSRRRASELAADRIADHRGGEFAIHSEGYGRAQESVEERLRLVLLSQKAGD